MPPRVVIDPGSHAVLNLGDVAMLRVAVDRLAELWPDAWIGALTTDPEALRRHVPRAEPLAAEGRYEMTAGYARTLAEADLFLVAGRGGLTDAQADEALALLAEIELALDAGTPVALMGQGVGPVHEPVLVSRAWEVLPRVAAIAVREGFLAVGLLEALGVPADRVTVTGDDSLELARAVAPEPGAGEAIGLNVRVAPYSDIGDEEAERVARVARAAAEQRGTRVAPLPVSLYPSEDEPARLARLAGADPGPVATVEDALARAGGCRAVVAGSYHAAVFALGQGVPVVALVGSPYYEWKMDGLREQFGGRMAVLRVGARLFEERLAAAIDAAWATPDADRAALVAAAERQVRAGREAYERLGALVAASVSAE